MQADTLISTRIVRLQGGGLRFLDTLDARVVTRPFHGPAVGQQWRLTDLGGGVCTIQQMGSDRYLTAAVGSWAVTATACADSTAERWRVDDLGGGFATVSHVGSERFLEALVDGPFSVVLRPAGSSEQTWRIGGR